LLSPDAVECHVCDTITHETPVQRRLRIETARLPDAGMQIGADLGAFLALLVRTIHARRALEIGTFTGYSALAVAAALPTDGLLVACDVNAEWTAIGRRHWEEAGVASRIDLRLGPAIETRRTGTHGTGGFDFASSTPQAAYDAYYEACLGLVRGRPDALDKCVRAARSRTAAMIPRSRCASRNAKISTDTRVEPCLYDRRWRCWRADAAEVRGS
jgi:predicted O-methyltransferase YrrM